MENTELIRPPDMQLVGDPAKQILQAKKAADALMEFVKARNAFTNFGTREKPKNHLWVEAWQMCAHFYGVSTKITTTDDWTNSETGETGFEAWCESLLISTGRVIGMASAICTNFEDNWDERNKYDWKNGQRVVVGTVPVPKFQLYSMAQTRATGKVLRGQFAFVVMLAGFETTPAEEMTGNERRGEQQTKTETKTDAPRVITEQERKQIWAAGKGLTQAAVVEVFNAHGFKIAAQITIDKFPAILADVQQKAKAAK